MANWFTQFAGGDGTGAGMGSYQRAIDAGRSPQDIARAAPSSGLTIGEKLQAHINSIGASAPKGIGAAYVQRELDKGRSLGEIQQEAISGGWTIGEKAQAMFANPGSVSASNQGYQNQLAENYQSQLDDYQDRFNTLTNQYQQALSGISSAKGEALDWQSKWQKSQSDYEAAKELADAYKEESIDRQLSGLQTGTTVQGRQTDPYFGLAGGSGDVSRAARDRDRMLDIEKKIAAEDSVLNRSGPVVQRMTSPSSPASSNTARSALASGGTSGDYYSSRFG